jgi:peptidoglycan/LPS O-acetylase OafA/YrhL
MASSAGTVPGSETIAAQARQRSAVTYIPALDGLRALAVIAVLVYHAGVGWLPGGFLGVDVFFVISGYLITLLLTDEHTSTASISLRGFWARRARRLLPALYALLFTTTLVVLVLYREELAGLRAQLWSALSYVTNWYFIASEQSYFAAIERPAILQHLWSLAIEEQFYLAWPVVLLVLLRLSGGRRRPVAAVAVAAAAASAIWMAVLFDPAADPSRVYYGTDTRSAGLLLGAALGLLWRPTATWRGGEEVSLVALDLGGWAALGALLACFVGIEEFDTFLYRGGFVVVAIASTTAIASAVHPSTVFGRALGHRTFTWVGLRSYALYLWHWPIFVLTRPEIDVPWSPYPTLALRLLLTVAAAEASYRYVEVPIRKGVLRHKLARRDHRGRPRRAPARAVAAGLALTSVLLLLAVNTIGGTRPAGAAQTESPSEPATAAAAGDGVAAPASPAATAARPIPDLTVLADSVLLGAEGALKDDFAAAGLDVEYRARPALMIHQSRAELQQSGARVGRVVIVGLGYNSLWERDRRNYEAYAEKFDREADELITTLRELGAERIVWVTLREPSPEVVPPLGGEQMRRFAWFFPYANERIRELPGRHPDVVLADWAAVSNARGLTYDAFHLTAEGIARMLDVLRPAVGIG